MTNSEDTKLLGESLESNRIFTQSQRVSCKIFINYKENNNHVTAEKPGRCHLNERTQIDLTRKGTAVHAVPPHVGHWEGHSITPAGFLFLVIQKHQTNPN